MCGCPPVLVHLLFRQYCSLTPAMRMLKVGGRVGYLSHSAYFCAVIFIQNMRKTLLLLACLLLAAPDVCTAQESLSNEVIDCILARRSVRKYKDQPVEHEKLAVLVNCGINAPNGMNRQPWALTVIEDAGFISETTALFVAKNPQMVEQDANFKNMYRNAPNLIAVASPEDGSGNVDAGLLAENIILAAQSMGLGTCCLGGPVQFLKHDESAQPYLQRLNIPEGYTLNFIIGVGYPDESPDAKPRDTSKVTYLIAE